MMGRRDESRAAVPAHLRHAGRTALVGRGVRASRTSRSGASRVSARQRRLSRSRPSELPTIRPCTPAGASCGFRLIISDEAAKSFQDALAADDKWIPALLGMARTLLDVNPPAAEKAVQQALALDPDVVAGHLIVAQTPARQERPRSGEGRPLRRRKPSIPSASTRSRSVARSLTSKIGSTDFQQDATAALKINPRFSDAYRVPADLAAANYRFEEAVALSSKALELDPERRAHARGVWRPAAAHR